MPDTPRLEVREPAFAADAPRQTVSLTINSDLYQKSKALGINVSRVAEQALGRELEMRQSAALLAEVRQDLAAAENYVARHGSFASMVREHYGDDSDDPV